jgi:peptidoglycan/xylan/chitin deacetylase (PgdA/CDA1 family)
MNTRLSQLNKLFYPGMITHLPDNEKKIYLTFDDGPTPEITNRVLALLFQFNIKATFFCRGDHVEAHPAIFSEIQKQGHTTGNHGYTHLHGWYTNAQKYIDDCNKAAKLIQNKIYRPPYGKITPAQYYQLKKEYTLYLWTALSWDFHPWVSKEMCYCIAKRNVFPGSILVFHDTAKAAPKLLYALPRLIEYGLNKGYQFNPLSVNTGSDRKDNVARGSF